MKSHLSSIFLFSLIAAIGILTYLILKPFLAAVLVAFLLSQLFKGWYLKLTKKLGGRKSLASFIACIAILVVLIIPFTIIISLVVQQANELYQTIQENNLREKIDNYVNNSQLLRDLGVTLRLDDLPSIITSEQFSQGARNVGNFILFLVRAAYENISNLTFTTIVMFFSLYYFFKDGDAFLKKFMQISPLKTKEEQMLIDKFIAISRATLKGTLVVAIIQGALVGIVFWLAGIPSPVVWAVIATVASLLPMIGASIIWLPVAIVTLALGNIWQGLLIILFGALVISTIDNVLRPKLVGNETELHPLLVFLSTLGGIALFGFSGFLLGPIIVVLFITLLDIYQIEYKRELRKIR